MKCKKAHEFTKDIKDSGGFKGMTANWLWTKEDGMDHFAMRLMEFEPKKMACPKDKSPP